MEAIFNQAERLAYHQSNALHKLACGHISLFALALLNNMSHHLSHAGVDFILQKARFHYEVISLISQVMNLIGESLYHCQKAISLATLVANITALAQ